MRPALSLTAGEALDGRTVGPVTQTDIVRFAGAGGDFNPLHHDADYAIATGLPGVIAMGQMQAGMLAAWVSDTVHVEHLLAYSVRFASPLMVGEVVTFTGTVDTVDQQTGTAALTLRAAVGDRIVVDGKATVRIASPH